ncbi:MAG: sigma-70 family RNA polymerase sigma factor [Bacteroidales bacterium]|jgi:RNA polymerase sigma-70 factor (ECF subfamily)
MIVDESILEGCIAGKRKAQYELYKKFAASMLAVCFRYARNRDEAEDFLQEGFLKVFQKISSFRSEGSFEGWMKRIMINNALNEIKKNRRTPFLEDIEVINETQIIDQNEPAASFDPVPPDVLVEMIRSLPEGYRIVFTLYVIEDFSHKEIANELNISENTSKTQLLKARRMLKNKLNKYYTVKKYNFVNE